MNVAFVGKGGAGKSAISGTFARLLARQGRPVLAIDSDPLPGMAFSLGLAIEHTPPIPEDATVQRSDDDPPGPRWRLRDGIEPTDAINQWSVEAPDGVRFLQFGKVSADTNSDHLWRAQVAFRYVLARLPDDQWDVVGDLPGGTRQAFTGWGDYARTVLVVVEPTKKSLLSARRLARMAHVDPDSPRQVLAVASKVRQPDDVDMIAEGTGLEVVASVPWDEALATAERQQRAPLDAAPDCPAVVAVGLLLGHMQSLNKELVL